MFVFWCENKSKKLHEKNNERSIGNADLDSLSEADVVELAKLTFKKRVEQIADALKQVSETRKFESIVTTGRKKIFFR